MRSVQVLPHVGAPSGWISCHPPPHAGLDRAGASGGDFWGVSPYWLRPARVAGRTRLGGGRLAPAGFSPGWRTCCTADDTDQLDAGCRPGIPAVPGKSASPVRPDQSTSRAAGRPFSGACGHVGFQGSGSGAAQAHGALRCDFAHHAQVLVEVAGRKGNRWRSAPGAGRCAWRRE